MRALILVPLLLAGCASPDYVATRSDMTVCRFTLGGPHAALADIEARRRGLNCMAMYPAIQAQMANENAATQSIQQMLKPPATPAAPPVNCRTVRVLNGWNTYCN